MTFVKSATFYLVFVLVIMFTLTVFVSLSSCGANFLNQARGYFAGGVSKGPK